MPWDGKKLPDELAAGATSAASAATNGSKNAAALAHVQSEIGANYKRKLVRNDVVVWEATVSGTLPISGNQIVLPSTATQTSIAAADIDTGEWVHYVENASTPTKYIATAVTTTAGSGPAKLSADLTAGGTVTLGTFAFNSYPFDSVTPPTGGGATFQSVALADMRKPGWTGSYATSYADNEAYVWGRGGSSQRTRASLTEGKYCGKTSGEVDTNGIVKRDSFVSSKNPDYALELAWGVTGSPPFFSAQYRTQPVARILFWNQVYLSETYTTAHLPGYNNNSRVMLFGAQIWIKRNGTWELINSSDSASGEAITPNFASTTAYVNTSGVTSGTTAHIDARVEPSTGYMSVRPVPDATSSPAPYRAFHGYMGGFSNINPAEIQDILVLQKAALVPHNAALADDRDYARFLLACGADYYPTSGFTFDNGWINFLAGIGTGRHKFVTAKWPAWQWHVMHTMSESQFNAPNGYPPALANLVEGTGSTPPPSTTSYPGVNDSRRFAWVDPADTWASTPTMVGTGASSYPYMQVNSVWTNPRPITEFPEPGVLAQARAGQTIPAGEYTIARVTHPTNSAKKAILHRIDSRYLAYSGNTQRSQFLTYAIQDNTFYWIAFSYRMGADAGSASINCFDIHTSGDSLFGRQPVELFWTGSSFRLEHFGQYDTGVTDPAGEIRTVSWESGTIALETWQHFVLKVRVAKSWAGNPSIQAWHASGNGTLTQVVNRSDIQMGFYTQTENQCFPKLGLYRWDLSVRATAHTTGLYIFRDGVGTPTLDQTSMHALLLDRQ